MLISPLCKKVVMVSFMKLIMKKYNFKYFLMYKGFGIKYMLISFFQCPTAIKRKGEGSLVHERIGETWKEEVATD